MAIAPTNSDIFANIATKIKQDNRNITVIATTTGDVENIVANNIVLMVTPGTKENIGEVQTFKAQQTRELLQKIYIEVRDYSEDRDTVKAAGRMEKWLNATIESLSNFIPIQKSLNRDYAYEPIVFENTTEPARTDNYIFTGMVFSTSYTQKSNVSYAE